MEIADKACATKYLQGKEGQMFGMHTPAQPEIKKRGGDYNVLLFLKHIQIGKF